MLITQDVKIIQFKYDDDDDYYYYYIITKYLMFKQIYGDQWYNL